jgi:hypothetical protein
MAQIAYFNMKPTETLIDLQVLYIQVRLVLICDLAQSHPPTHPRQPFLSPAEAFNENQLEESLLIVLPFLNTEPLNTPKVY